MPPIAHDGLHLALNLASAIYLAQILLCLVFIAWCGHLIWRRHRGS